MNKITYIIMAIAMIVLILAAAGCASEPYVPEPTPSGPVDYTLVWQDEFAGPAGQSPDPAKWTYDVGGWGWGNEQLEHNTARPENVSLDGQGHLRIIAREESYQGNDYTSARIKTQGRFTQAYGRFEARIQLPVGQGLWPAFWMLGADFGTVGWPDCGEIDVMEYRGQIPRVVSGALHGPGYSGNTPLVGSYSLNGGGFHEDFHIFAIEWTGTTISWSVDGTTYMTKGVRDLPGGTRWVFDHPFFLLLNVAVGGTYVGDPNASTQFPQTMLVDYVRVYRAD